MAERDPGRFDAGAYWRERVGADADLAVVGHRAMGAAYNGEIYSRRIEALESMIERHISKSSDELRVLDIGCGSGFYTRFWQSKNVDEYVGVDISDRTVEHLSEIYPDFKFVCSDITEPVPVALAELRGFDVITIFDVLYHIVDNQRVERAIANVGELIAEDGKLLIMDQLCKREYQVSKHVVYRGSDRYLEMFGNNALVLADRELLFHFLVPPITGIKVIDFLSAGFFKVFGLTLRLNDRLAAWAALKLKSLDNGMRRRGVRVPNCEFFVFKRSSGDNIDA